MLLITKEIASRLPSINAVENTPGDEQIVVLKMFGIGTAGGADYYITAADLDTGTLFGFCCPMGWDAGEWGEVSLAELQGLQWAGIPAIERDSGWPPTRFGDIRSKKEAPPVVVTRPALTAEQEASIAQMHAKDAADKRTRGLRRPAFPPTLQKWSLDSTAPAGPIQIKRIENVVSNMKIAADEILKRYPRGDGTFSTSRVLLLGIGRAPVYRQEFYDEYLAIYEKFGGIISKTNAALLLKTLEAARVRLEAARPVVNEHSLEIEENAPVVAEMKETRELVTA